MDPIQELLLEGRVDPGERLVEQHHLGVGHQRAGHLQQLPLAAGEVPRVLVREVVDLEELQRLPRPLAERGLLLDHPAAKPGRHRADRGLAELALRREHEVLQHGHLGELPGDLERSDEPFPGDLIRLEPGDVLALEVHLAGGRLVDAGDTVERRRLPGAVRPDQAGQRPGLHLEGGPVDGGDAAEPLHEPLDAERRCPRGGPRRNVLRRLFDRAVVRLRFVAGPVRRRDGLGSAELSRAGGVVRVGDIDRLRRVVYVSGVVRVSAVAPVGRVTHRTHLRSAAPRGRRPRPSRSGRRGSPRADGG
ncbi:membrane associated protein [Halorubrum distributum JCM 13561]|uniref:Membrane associated protein n=1 Tax=Halorubrum distributum JCM 13561 TaxID=1227483 RepID=M0NLF0_9EURY|nr:membrane associated protein [Halorubrum litoreum JCM 13561]